MVMHSFYNGMLGEFYERGLVPLNEIVKRQAGSLDLFRKGTQLYIHRYHDRNAPSSLLDSHFAFTEPFSEHPLQDFTKLLDGNRCRCLDRVFLCGYREKEDTQDARVDDSKVLIGSANVLGLGNSKKVNNVHQDLKYRLRDQVIDQKPMVLRDIRSFKRKVLESKGVDTAKQDVDQYKFVGLAQRNGRRRWTNVNKVESLCNHHVLTSYKVVCTTVNVEIKESRFHYHAVAHGALDALVGVHGAQLTEAVWMKPDSLVVELLPWIHPTMKWGEWTRFVTRVTPLGVIFQQTDLNHIGYPLTKKSAAEYCNNATASEEEERKCWGSNAWANRDFSVDPTEIVELVKNFVVKQSENCTELQEAANRTDSVLYNVNCQEERENQTSPHSYYWSQKLNTIPKYS